MNESLPADASAVPSSSSASRAPGRASPVTEDPWAELGRFTDARIGLGRCGVSLPVSRWLDFRLAHARARDAVFAPLDGDVLERTLAEHGIECLRLSSAAAGKNEFLARPDKGRRLSADSRRLLDAYREKHPGPGPDLCMAISDGLSARAVHENAAPFAALFLEHAQKAGLSAAPVALVENGRVAVGDETAALLDARLAVVLIGERPGLSSPHSLGVYMTYAPAPGCADHARNCISNVRSGGLSVEEGVRKLCYLVEEAFVRRFSGVNLKDEMPDVYLPFAERPSSLGMARAGSSPPSGAL